MFMMIYFAQNKPPISSKCKSQRLYIYVSVFQESGLSWSLSDQNVTLLVPSSAAVAKMSSEDKNFWTTKGNLPSLIRLQLSIFSYRVFYFRTIERLNLNVKLKML